MKIFRAPQHKNCTKTLFSATAPRATAMPRTPFWAGFGVQICVGVGPPGVGENLAFAFDKPQKIAPHGSIFLAFYTCNINGGCHGQCCALPVGARSTPTLDVDAIMWTPHMQPPFQKIAPPWVGGEQRAGQIKNSAPQAGKKTGFSVTLQ